MKTVYTLALMLILGSTLSLNAAAAEFKCYASKYDDVEKNRFQEGWTKLTVINNYEQYSDFQLEYYKYSDSTKKKLVLSDAGEASYRDTYEVTKGEMKGRYEVELSMFKVKSKRSSEKLTIYLDSSLLYDDQPKDKKYVGLFGFKNSDGLYDMNVCYKLETAPDKHKALVNSAPWSENVRLVSDDKTLPAPVLSSMNSFEISVEMGDGYYDFQKSAVYKVYNKSNKLVGYMLAALLSYTEDPEYYVVASYHGLDGQRIESGEEHLPYLKILTIIPKDSTGELRDLPKELRPDEDEE